MLFRDLSVFIICAALTLTSTKLHAEAHLYNPPKGIPASEDVIVHTTEGNLQVTDPLGCTDISQIKANQTPADIFVGTRNCLENDDITKAAELTAAAYVLARYDRLRVADRTAHQAFDLLLLNSMHGLPQTTIEAFREELSKPETPSFFCDALSSLAIPEYFPTYMIEHGIKAFGGPQPNKGIIEGFDSQHAWQVQMPTRLHCLAE